MNVFFYRRLEQQLKTMELEEELEREKKMTEKVHIYILLEIHVDLHKYSIN